MLSRHFIFLDRFFLGGYYAEDGSQDNQDNQDNKDNSKDNQGDQGKDKKFTQDEVNQFLAKDRRAREAQNKKLLSQLEELQSNLRMTEEQKQQFEAQIDTLRTQTLTAEEQARRATEKVKAEADKKLTLATQEAERWRTRYTDASITREISDASVVNLAINPTQIIALLRPNTRLEETVDAEGRPSGEFVAKVKFADKDKDGKPITLDLTVADAVKRMREMTDTYGNLFRSEGTPGTGRSSGRGAAGDSTPPTDMAAYMEWRKTHALPQK